MSISASDKGMRPGVCTSTSRPANPYIGQMIFETDTSRVKVWLGSAWSTGTSHTTSLNIEYLVVAGGGGGGGWGGGGGGAGGLRTNVVGATSGGGAGAEASMALEHGNYTITVGGGGASHIQGNNSVLETITSLGGGGAGGLAPSTAGVNATSGGSGVVIVRYLTSSASGLSITGGTATTSGTYTIRTFTASGSLVIA